jgi:hypothetical protein
MRVTLRLSPERDCISRSEISCSNSANAGRLEKSEASPNFGIAATGAATQPRSEPSRSHSFLRPFLPAPDLRRFAFVGVHGYAGEVTKQVTPVLYREN